MARFLLQTLTPRPRLVVRGADGERDCLRFSKQLAVLTYLAARPTGAATRDELLSLLWDDSALRDARHALRQAVHQIRQNANFELVSGDTLLAVRRDEMDFDVTLFREHLSAGRLDEALTLYQADFLATVGLAGAVEFEQWAEGLRRQLAAERRQLLRTFMARATDEGRWSQAARCARDLIEDDPEDMEPRLRLVELMAVSGDTVGAQLAADQIRHLTERTLGAHVPEATEAAIARALAAGHGPERRRTGGFPRHPEMVGRATEFRRVVEAWKGALAGHGGCVLISGESGSGKTRLVRELQRRLRRDPSLVLSSRCYAVEGVQPLAPFLEMIATAYDVPGLAGALPASLEVLAAMVPGIAGRFRNAIAPRRLPLPAEALAGALLDGFTAIAEEVPVALVIEDLQWASPHTIAFAHRLTRRAQQARLLLLLSAQDVARTPDQTRSLRDLAAGDAVDVIGLVPLDAADVTYLLSTIARLPDGPTGTALAARVIEHTEGVPLYVLELLKLLYDEGQLAVRDGAWVIPEGLTDPGSPFPAARSRASLLHRRLETLDPTTRTVLAALAIWGRAATVQEIAMVARLSESTVKEGLDLLARRRLLAQPSEGKYAVVHDQIGAVARSEISPALAAELARYAATLAELRAAAGLVDDWFLAARHAAAAGDPVRAVRAVVHGVATIEACSGREAALRELSRWLDSLPAPFQADVAALLPAPLRVHRPATGSTNGAVA